MRVLVPLTLGFTGLFACSAQAQFDFGDVLSGGAQQIVRGVGREVRSQIQQGGFQRFIPPQQQVLPFPPPANQPPRCQQPPVYSNPVIQPVQPPVTNWPVQPAPQPISQPIPQPGEVISGKPVAGCASPKCRIVNDQPLPPPEVELGSVVSIEGDGFGSDPGAVFIKIDSLVLSTDLVGWAGELVEVQMPKLPIAEPVQATLFVMAANEEIVEEQDVLLVPVGDAPQEGEAEDASQTAEDESETPTVQSGQEITLEGELGMQTGRIDMQVGQLRLQAKVMEWSETTTTIRLPELKTAEPVRAKLIIYRADGAKIEEIEVVFSA